MNIDDIFESLGDEAPDIGCAAGFELLHRYVESGLDGGDPAAELLAGNTSATVPGLSQRLRRSHRGGPTVR